MVVEVGKFVATELLEVAVVDNSVALVVVVAALEQVMVAMRVSLVAWHCMNCL